uniref:AlNc14C206G8816 protein n=1 Tax=Albugo laibachii Nc14 TaxID=890382 RepID=F0WR08_9STRA|nr:AlNc14C206G8816 [Albugo laibachii Nc14]|eukprot:CCA23768.1 AlNc14C206G8816 [Albugo laibachii Nc14]
MFGNNAFEKEQKILRQREYSQALAQQVQEQTARKQREKDFEKHGAWPVPSPSISAPSNAEIDRRQDRGLFDNLGLKDYDGHGNFARGQHRVPEQPPQRQATYQANDPRVFHAQQPEFMAPQLNHSDSRREIPYDMRYTNQMMAPQPTFTVENGYHEGFQHGFPEPMPHSSERDNNCPETYHPMERVQSQQSLSDPRHWQAEPVSMQPSGRRVRTDLRGSVGEEVIRKKQQQQDMNNALRKQIDEKNQRKEEEKRKREQEERRELESIQIQERLKLENDEKQRQQNCLQRENEEKERREKLSQRENEEKEKLRTLVEREALELEASRRDSLPLASLPTYQAPVMPSYEPTFAPLQPRNNSLADNFVADTQQKYENICLELQKQRQLVEEIKSKQESRPPDPKTTDPNCAIEKLCEVLRRELAEREKSQLECVKNLFKELQKIPAEKPITPRTFVKEMTTSQPLLCESELIFNENINFSPPSTTLLEDSLDKLAKTFHDSGNSDNSKHLESVSESASPTIDSLDFFMRDPSLLDIRKEPHRYKQGVNDEESVSTSAQRLKTPSYLASLDAHSNDVSLSDEAIDAIFQKNMERYASLNRQEANQCVQSLSTTSWQPWRLHTNGGIKR